MPKVINGIRPLKRNSFLIMIVAVVVFFVFSGAYAQDQALTSATPQSPPMPFLDLFTGASNYYSDSRKPYSDTSYYHSSCQKTDALSSFASMLGSAAKIMLSATVIAVLKLVGAKLLFLPISVMVIAKLGLKAILMWPVISKMIKYFKKKKKKSKSRIIMDCSERLACVIQRSYKSSWGSNFGAAVTFSLIEDVDEDSSIAKILLSILAGDKVAQCMSMDCNAGIDIS